MRWVAVLLCGFFFLTTPMAAAAAEQAAAPVAELETLTHDFGQASQGEVIKYDFRVFNRGKAPLEIKDVKPG